jgi:hypothetical protein
MLRLTRRGLSGPTLPVGELSATDLIGGPDAAVAVVTAGRVGVTGTGSRP